MTATDEVIYRVPPATTNLEFTKARKKAERAIL